MQKQKQRLEQQVVAAQVKAVRAAEVLQQDDDLADELESLTPEEYAERRGWEIVSPNPIKRRKTMTRAQMAARIRDLKAENEELLSENEELAEKLDSITAIIEPDDGDEVEDDDEE